MSKTIQEFVTALGGPVVTVPGSTVSVAIDDAIVANDVQGLAQAVNDFANDVNGRGYQTGAQVIAVAESAAATSANYSSTRAAAAFVQSDGATSNRAQVQTPGARGNLAGAPVASWVGWVDVPTSNPVAAAGVFVASSSVTSAWPADSLSCEMLATGALLLRQRANPNTHYREASHGAFRAAYSGQRIWLEVRFTKGTASPVVRVNGVDVSASFAAATAGTPPEWLDSGLNTTYQMTGYNWPAGIAPSGQWLNAHLSNAESEAWRLNGRPPAWVAAGGSSVPRTLSTWTNAGYAAYATFSGASASGYTALAVAPSWGIALSIVTGGVVAGRRYRLRYDLNLHSGVAPAINTNDGVMSYDVSLTAGVGKYTDFTAATTSTTLAIGNRGTSADYSLANASLTEIGALSLPAVQAGSPVVDDVTAIGGNQARLVGMVPVVLGPYAPPQIVVPAQAFSAGVSVQVLGGPVVGAKKQRVVSISGTSSASTTVSVGTSSGGTQIVNAQAVNGDFDLATFASRIVAAGSSLWITFAGATTASVTVRTSDL